ncbi:MAG: flagellar M-ring protein FliF, partial [Pseudomonadota bacterium]
MERLIATWREMELARRLALVGALVVTLAAVGTIAMMAGRPGMALLYAGLEPAAAGEMIGALEQMGAVHEVRGNAIFVEEGARDRLRLALAGDGLPSQGQKGYELLEGLSGFSATTDMFNAAYWRAKEGELARTIAAQPTIRSARVHIAIAPQRRFARERTPPTASVTVTGAGGSVTAQQAAAIRYMVALAVPGLPP